MSGNTSVSGQMTSPMTSSSPLLDCDWLILAHPNRKEHSVSVCEIEVRVTRHIPYPREGYEHVQNAHQSSPGNSH